MISFIIPGEPVAKGRAKVTTINGFARMYTPTKTLSYESKVALFASQAMAGRELISGPVSLQVHAFFAIPKSWTKKRTAAHLACPEWVSKKPDWDNVGKICSDAMNQIVWLDDSQVVTAAVTKIYASIPRVEIIVVEVV